MKCVFCNKDLDFPESVLEQLSVCPFCQSPLKNNENSLESFFKNLVSKYGEDVFSEDGNQDIYEILKDYPKQFERECHILRLLMDFQIPKTLYEALDNVEKEKPAVVKSVERLCKCLYMPSDTAFLIVKALAESMGFNTIDKIKEVRLEQNELKNLFETLGVSENSSMDVVKSAYRKIVMTCHPDKNPDNDDAVKKFRDAQEAYEILSNPQKREQLTKSNESSDFLKKMEQLVKDYPSFGDNLYLLFILEYAFKIYEARKKTPAEQAAILRDCVIELHSLLGISSSNLWESVKLIADKFGVGGTLCNAAEDLVTEDGIHYRTIKILDDVWMVENYKYASPKSKIYAKDDHNIEMYGRLYTWEDARANAPKGWHLPTADEYEKMFNFFGTKESYALRSQNYMNSSNLSGFCDMPAGAYDRHPMGGFHSIGLCSYYWTSSRNDKIVSCVKIDENSATFNNYDTISNLFSVRYVKNQPGYKEETDISVSEIHDTDVLKNTNNNSKNLNVEIQNKNVDDGFDGVNFVDSRDGEKYSTVLIDGKVWLAENFRFHNSNSYAFENNDEYVKKYGRLYTWESAKDACPEGWHLPTKDEFIGLLKSALRHCDKNDLSCALKAKDAWYGGFGGGTTFGGDDVLNLKIFPSGAKDSNGNFIGGPEDSISMAIFWGADHSESANKACNFALLYDSKDVNISEGYVGSAVSVRYVRNQMGAKPMKKNAEEKKLSDKSKSTKQDKSKSTKTVRYVLRYDDIKNKSFENLSHEEKVLYFKEHGKKEVIKEKKKEEEGGFCGAIFLIFIIIICLKCCMF